MQCRYYELSIPESFAFLANVAGDGGDQVVWLDV
jgi:hypothetical protein